MPQAGFLGFAKAHKATPICKIIMPAQSTVQNTRNEHAAWLTVVTTGLQGLLRVTYHDVLSVILLSTSLRFVSWVRHSLIYTDPLPILRLRVAVSLPMDVSSASRLMLSVCNLPVTSN